MRPIPLYASHSVFETWTDRQHRTFLFVPVDARASGGNARGHWCDDRIHDFEHYRFEDGFDMRTHCVAIVGKDGRIYIGAACIERERYNRKREFVKALGRALKAFAHGHHCMTMTGQL